MATSTHHRSGFGYLPALDGLRALAVAAVLAFHGGMPWARGGFLGVDAFFVLSGFLITSLLVAEWERTGRVRLGAFWLRRVRRLLPALLLVIGVCVVTARTLLPAEEVRQLRGDGLAALFYVANWRMILRGGDYFAQTAAPSPLEHTWSLAVEEQFYLGWPLLIALLLAGSATVAARHTALRRVLLLCGLGTAASTVLLAVTYDATDPGRAYYGTDTRGGALLIGAGLAVILARYRPDDPSWTPSRRVRVALGLPAVGAALGLAWAWTHAEGGDRWLYGGGLAALAVAVAVLLAQVVLVPRGWPARLLALPPLVLLGRVSYGVYLWHWPVFIVVNADRTGRQGESLFLARCLVTFALATLSYVLVERPVRVRRAGPGRRVVLERGGVLAGVAVVAALVFVTTAVQTPGLASGGLALPATNARDGIHSIGPSTPAGREQGRAQGPGPGRHTAGGVRDHHPRPGRTPVVAVFGDSIAWTLMSYLPSDPNLDVRDRTMLGCGVARTGPYRYFGQLYPGVSRDCREWPNLWRRAISADDPDVALIMVGRWETMDRTLDGRWSHVGQPAFDAYLRSELELAIETAGSHGARVLLATAPYNRRGEQLDGSLFPEDHPERVTAWNALLREVVADHRNVGIVEFGDRITPDGEFTWTAGGIQVRSDGVHLTPSGVQDWIAPWLLPQLIRAVR